MVVVEVPVFFIVIIVLSVAIVYGAVASACVAIAVPQLLMGASTGFSHKIENASGVSASISGIFFVYYIVSGMIYGMQSISFPYLQDWIRGHVVSWADSPTSRQFMPPIAHHLAYIVLGMLLTSAIAFFVTLCVAPFVGAKEEERKAY